MYQLWKWKAFVHVIIITTTATIMHHHPQLLLMQMVYTRRQQNNLSTKTTPPPHHHHHFTCQLHYHVKPFPIHRHCTILQLYLWIMVMLMVLIYYYPPPHLNDVSLGYSHPQWLSTMRRKRWWQWWWHKNTAMMDHALTIPSLHVIRPCALMISFFANYYLVRR